jgi:hypothetical protein
MVGELKIFEIAMVGVRYSPKVHALFRVSSKSIIGYRLTPKSINLGYRIYTVFQYPPMMDFEVSTENQNFNISKNRFFTKIQKVAHINFTEISKSRSQKQK